jgi:arsenate reductase
MTSVLFVCLHNAGRSQMSEALFEVAADGRHSASYIDWELPDPSGRPTAEVRATRDEIARRVGALCEELDGRPPAPAAP